MGGGGKVQQTNAGQATAANAGATGAANQGTALSQQYNQQQQQQYNNLFGANGKGGAVGGMLDPSKLNVTSPTGPYGLMFTQQKEQLAKGYKDAQGATDRTLAQSGFGPGTPSGFAANLQAENSRGLADSTGKAYSDATNNSYQDALANFWKAAGTSQAQGTASQGAALQGNNTAAQTYGNLYGTAGHGNVLPPSGIGNSLIGAAGTVGGAAMTCVCPGTKIRTGDHILARVEHLRIGDRVVGVEGRVTIIREPEHAEVDCVAITTETGLELLCSEYHTILRPLGGYVRAKDALGADVLTWTGKDKVVEVKKIGKANVVKLELDGSHTYQTGGIWSEE